MKCIYKFLIIVFMLSFSCCYAENSDNSRDASEIFNKGFSNQKLVTDSTFKKTIEEIKERSLTNKQKKIKAMVQPHSPAADGEHFKMFAKSQDPDDELSQSLTVMIPVNAYSDNGILIPAGYYKLSCRKISDNTYVLDLSQGTKRIISVEAAQTQEDLEQESIQFCNAEIISNGRIRLMYGTIDLNLVGYIYYD